MNRIIARRVALLSGRRQAIIANVSLTTKTLRITEETPEDLRKADRAVQSLAGTSRRQTAGLFDQKCVLLNGQPCETPWQRLAVGDNIELRYDPGQRYSPIKKPPKYVGFEILFEDAHVIIVNKPAGWLTVPSRKKEKNTLVQRISAYLTKMNRRRLTRATAVHRLDRGVSGVLVFAKTESASSALRQQFANREPDREYVAIVAGKVEKVEGTFQSYLATSSKSLKRYSTKDAEKGELAITHFRVEKYLTDATLVRVRLETGRRNQIRVHFADVGHPVLGDLHYQHELAQHPRWNSQRLALHATLLDFQHPVTGQYCRYEVPPPKEFGQFLSEQARN